MTKRPAPPALLVDGVSKHFGEVDAVCDVSVEVDDAELLALVGPSGCGKSTLLRMIAGLIPIETGTIELSGTIVDDGSRALPPERRRVGLVFQEHALFPHLTVARNIGFGVRSSSGDRKQRVAEMLDLVGLTRYGDRFPHELSGGERQRVALARALAPNPALMLLDEPFASLDPNLRTQVRGEVVEALRRTGTPAVFVTHDQAEALAVGDRIAVMDHGRVLQVDTPDRIFHRPASCFVASFMGEADFMTVDAFRSAFATAPSIDDPGPGAVLMVRPDDVTFVETADGSAEVVHSEFRGAEWCYTLRLADGATVRSARSHVDAVAVGVRVSPALVDRHPPVVVPCDGG